jgi:hypothetical protein
MTPDETNPTAEDDDLDDQISFDDPGFHMSPMPMAPPGARERDPELYKAWVEHIKSGYKNNDEVFSRVLDAFMRSHRATLIMYWILFAVGVGFFMTAVILALVRESLVVGAVFGGLSVVSFLAYFVSRPTQAVEENLQFVTWLGIIYNSYWTHLAWAFDSNTAQDVLDKATDDALTQIKELIDRHAEATRRRPGPGRQANEPEEAAG